MDIDFFNIGVAYAALLFIFVLCGVLRCLDVWTPLGVKNADEIYPARRIVACIYFSVVLLLPCALHPQSTDAQLLARCFWVLFIPAATALGYKRFFFGDKLHKRLRIALVGGVPVLFTLALSCVALVGGDVLAQHEKAVIHAAGILGALLTAYEIHVMIWLFHIMSGVDVAARTADKLFPKNFALRMLWVSSLVLIATWVVFLLDSVFANAAFAGSIALIGLLILLVILHPQRVEKETEDGKDKKDGVPVMAAVTSNGDTVQVAVPDDEQPDEDAVAFVKAAFSAPAPCQAESKATKVTVEAEDCKSETDEVAKDVCEILPTEETSTDEETTGDAMLSEVEDEPTVTDACRMENENAGNADLEEDADVESENAEDDNEADGDSEGGSTPDEAPQETTQPKEKKYTLSDAQLDNIERQIRDFVEGKKQYLDPKLVQKTLEEKLGVNHYYLSEVFARRFGSLSQYLKTLRMEQAIRYVAEHPNAKQVEVAHHSGFGSEKSYYRAKITYEAEKLSQEKAELDNTVDSSDL